MSKFNLKDFKCLPITPLTKEEHTCPICGSTNIFMYAEHILEARHNINKNGKTTQRPYEVFHTGHNASGLQCNDCGYILESW